MWSWIVHGVSWFTAALGALTLERVAIIIGIATSVAAFLLNLYYKRKHYMLATEIAKQNAMCAVCPKVQGDE
ncbi:MAG: HP1 family phage holin [Sulfuricella sp.]